MKKGTKLPGILLLVSELQLFRTQTEMTCNRSSPKSRIIETDAPYLPIHKEYKINHPWNLYYTAEHVPKIRNVQVASSWTNPTATSAVFIIFMKL